MQKINYTYCDANVFLDYLNANKDHINLLEQFFQEVHQNKNRKIVTSILSITEVAHSAEEKTNNRVSAKILRAINALWGDPSLIEFTDFNELLARQARDLIRQSIDNKLVLRPNDSIHLVSARYVGVTDFFTYDKKLYKFSSVMGYNIVEPFIHAQQLPLQFDETPPDSDS